MLGTWLDLKNQICEESIEDYAPFYYHINGEN